MISAGAQLALRFVRSPETAPGDDPEFSRVLRICDPLGAAAGGLTFLPAAGLSSGLWLAEWEGWRDGLFDGCLADALEGTARCAAAGQAREIGEIDLALGLALPAAERERSSAAGRELYAGMDGVRGERWFNKLQRSAADGTLPAHFAVAYACRYASFHLPGRLLLPTYAYWEWSAALAVRPLAGGSLPDFTAVAPAPPPSETALRASGAE